METNASSAKPQSVEEKTIAELQEGLAPYFARERHTARVWNKALPDNPLEIFDWYPQFVYKWVPAPGGTNDSRGLDIHEAPEMHARRSHFIRQGWQFYPSDKMETEPGRGLPWVNHWDDDRGRVRLNHHWLMYADKDYEANRYQDNIDRWNRTRMPKSQEGVKAKSAEGDSNALAVGVQSEVEKVPLNTVVPDLLSEGGNEAENG